MSHPPQFRSERWANPQCSQPKAQPRSAAGKKQNIAAAKATGPKGAAAANANKKRRGRNARPAKKTAEELDSDMADYFVNANNNEAAGGAPAAAPANGDAAMEDEIMVSLALYREIVQRLIQITVMVFFFSILGVMAFQGTSGFRYQCINEKKKLKTGSAHDRLIKRHTTSLTEMVRPDEIVRAVILEALGYNSFRHEICFYTFLIHRFTWTGAGKRVL